MSSVPRPDDLTDAAFAAIVDTAVSPYGIVDDLGTVLWIGSSMAESTGWAAEDLVGRNMLETLDEASQAAVIDSFTRFTETASDGPGWLGTGLLLNVVSPSGDLVPVIASSATSVRTGVRGMVIQLFRAAATTYLHDAVRAMSTGRTLDEVLGHLASMVGSEIAGATVEIGWDWDGAAFGGIVGGDVGLLGADLDGRADGDRPWAAAMATGVATSHDDLSTMPAAVAERARTKGFIGCWVQPIAVDAV